MLPNGQIDLTWVLHSIVISHEHISGQAKVTDLDMVAERNHAVSCSNISERNKTTITSQWRHVVLTKTNICICTRGPVVPGGCSYFLPKSPMSDTWIIQAADATPKRRRVFFKILFFPFSIVRPKRRFIHNLSTLHACSTMVDWVYSLGLGRSQWSAPTQLLSTLCTASVNTSQHRDVYATVSMQSRSPSTCGLLLGE